MIDLIILLPAFLSAFVGYYIIISRQYLLYDIKIGHFIFWISAAAQGLVDYLNIYYAENSTFNEILAGGISFFCIFITSIILIFSIIKKYNSIYVLIIESELADKIALIIFTIFILVFLFLEKYYIFENNQNYEYSMAVIAISLDIIALYIIKNEIYLNVKQQIITPWVLWSFGLLWFCILEALLNYQDGKFPSIGWIMLIENCFIVSVIGYFIYDAQKKFSTKK